MLDSLPQAPRRKSKVFLAEVGWNTLVASSDDATRYRGPG